jgi:DNA-binding transcriptional LysR family regulator
MDRKSFDWTLVRSFVAVLDAGSLMGAARQLNARQPTLSRHIAELEAQVGAALFERSGRGMVPTATAEALARAARDMAMGADAFAGTLTGRRAATSGTVRITTSQVAASHLLPRVLSDLQRIEPGIQVEVAVSNAVTNLLRREADIAIRMVRPAQASLVARKLGDIAITACAHRSYLQRAGTPQSREELLRHRLIGYDRDDTILRGFARLGVRIEPGRFAVRTDDHMAYGHLVATGAGIGFLAAYSLEYWEGVVPILPELKIPPLPCWLAVHREIRGNPIVRRVYDFIAAAVVQRLRDA